MGLPEAIAESISRCPEETRRWLFANIVLTGGCMAMPNARERVEREVRKLAPEQYQVRKEEFFL